MAATVRTFATSVLLRACERVGVASQRFGEWNTIAGVPNGTVMLAIWVCLEFWRTADGRRMKPLQAFVATFLVGFGGSTIAAIMLGKPWGLLQGNVNLPVYAAVAALVYFSPNDAVFRALNAGHMVLAPFLTFAEAVSKASTVSKTGVDGVLGHASGAYSDSIFSAIVVGTISGCGGGILGSLLGLRNASWSLDTPSQFRTPNKSMILSFFSALGYLFLFRTPVVGRTAVGAWMSLAFKRLGMPISMNAPLWSEQQVFGAMVAMIWIANNWDFAHTACSRLSSMSNVLARLPAMKARSSGASDDRSPARKAGKSRVRRSSPKRK